MNIPGDLYILMNKSISTHCAVFSQHVHVSTEQTEDKNSQQLGFPVPIYTAQTKKPNQRATFSIKCAVKAFILYLQVVNLQILRDKKLDQQEKETA